MPTPPKRLGNMSKHLTSDDIKKREAAEGVTVRDGKRRYIKKPGKIVQNAQAKAVWERTIRSLEGVDLLDNADADTLAQYCMISVRIDMLEREIYGDGDDTRRGAEDATTLIQRLEAAERIKLAYADKLGLTPQGRARLAVRIAKAPEEAPEEKDLYGD